MTLISLLGKQLKADEMIEALEDFEMLVEYDFDRLHENTPDKYWATSKPNGLQFQFDEHQALRTIFIYCGPIDEFAPFSASGHGITFCATPEAAEQWARESGFKSERIAPREFQGIVRESVRTEKDGACVHYEFRPEGPSMITLFLKK